MSENKHDQEQQAEAKPVDEKLENVSTGGHLGGTHFGQAPGDAKTKEDRRDGGRKSRANDGNN